MPGCLLTVVRAATYNTFRFYDPDVGRFINQEPIGLLVGDNLNAYAPSSTGWINPRGWCITTIMTRGTAGQPLRATATITANDIGTGTATNASSRAFARLLGRSSDDMGHIFAKLLGGSGGKGNILPKLSNINRGAFSPFESQVTRQAKQPGQVDVEVIFNYANCETRFTSLLYNVCDKAGNLISQILFSG
ncbi:DNA/RNA non-specific endonuclease [Burkholderia anthina]|uniref:DNA/RNA non-specific endonuclease n=1 Tax=Burkholderia anthina TaxID=179879 RepID=UPI0024457D4B|nr:DNA/RNA non-specific endonuclease [Burkholderia anthina]